VTVQPSNKPTFTMPITLRVCSDNLMLCFFLWQGPSLTKWCCIYCFWIHHFPGVQSSWPLQVDLVHRQAAAQGLGGYPDPSCTKPLVEGVEPYNVVFCILHALTCIGNLVVDWLHDWTMNQPDCQVLLVKVSCLCLTPSSLSPQLAHITFLP
jgi:hypothetical protein